MSSKKDQQQTIIETAFDTLSIFPYMETANDKNAVFVELINVLCKYPKSSRKEMRQYKDGYLLACFYVSVSLYVANIALQIKESQPAAAFLIWESLERALSYIIN